MVLSQSFDIKVKELEFHCASRTSSLAEKKQARYNLSFCLTAQHKKGIMHASLQSLKNCGRLCWALMIWKVRLTNQPQSQRMIKVEPGQCLAAHLRCKEKKKITKTNGITVTDGFVLLLCDFSFQSFRLFSASKEYLWLFLQKKREKGESVCANVCIVANHTICC